MATLNRMFLYLIYGCLLHGVAWLLLRSDRHKTPAIFKQRIPVSIQFGSSKNPEHGTRAHGRPHKVASTGEGMKISREKSKAEYPLYSSLLPKPAEISEDVSLTQGSSGGISSSKHIWSQGIDDKRKRSLLRNAGALFARINVPLTARSQLDPGKATARLAFDRDTQVMTMIILQGQPILRAVLFKCITEQENQDVIRSMFEILALRELTLSLHIIAGSHDEANDDAFTWRENRLDLYVTKGSNGFSGRNFHWGRDFRSISFTLPDEKADRAKAIDEAENLALKESPAYSHILSNRAL